MASRLKEDERNERAIRNLLKLPENRRCINCNSSGPQYVCTNFWTFVCTTCSGIHREFTHRVKSISMAKFTSQEVSALQGGGNASAKEIYLKEWDPQRNSLPDGSNIERLRDFIKHVYVDRRYTGEKSLDKHSRGKMGEMEDANQNRRLDAFQGGSRSPPYEDTHELRYSGRASPAGRSAGGSSPGYDQDSFQQSDNKRSPAQAEVINDWHREDRFRNGRISEDNRTFEVGSKKYPEISSPPTVRPVREILGENVSPLRVIEPPRANSARSADGSLRTQRTVSSSSLASSNGNPAEIKTETSLIDFDAVPEPPATAPAPQTQKPLTGIDISQQTAPSVANNWANFDSVAEVKVAQAPSNANTLESVLSELSGPTSIPAQYGETSLSDGASMAASASNAWDFTSSNSAAVSLVPPFSNVPATPPLSHSMAIPPAGAPGITLPALGSQVPGGGGNSYVNAANGEQWTHKQPQQPTAFLGSGSVTTPQPLTPAAGGTPSNQPWNALVAPNLQGPPHATVAQASSLAATNSGLEAMAGVMTNTPVGGRKVLPEDLFTAPIHGWHTGPPHGYGLNVQYRMHMPMPTFQQLPKSTNPFDVGNEQPPVRASSFPSMASLQGALPNMVAPTGLMRTSSLGTPFSTWTGLQPSQPLAIPPQAPSFQSAVLPGMYLGQEAPSNIWLRQQGAAGFDLGGSPFGSVNPNQQLGGLYSGPPTQNTLSSVGGNPFG